MCYSSTQNTASTATSCGTRSDIIKYRISSDRFHPHKRRGNKGEMTIATQSNQGITDMKISKISVRGLFNRFDHDLVFKPEERIMIIFGQNGFGKTMTLRIINTLFNKRLPELLYLPFKGVTVTFNDGSILSINRTSNKNRSDESEDMVIEFKSKEEEHKIKSINSRETLATATEIGNMLPFIERIGQDEWIDDQTDTLLSSSEIIAKYVNAYGRNNPRLSEMDPDWIKQIRQAIPVHFIDIERLVTRNINRSGRHRVHYSRNVEEIDRTVKRYSIDLGERVKNKLTEYATLSQSLDRTFPTRLVEEPIDDAPSMQELDNQLSNIENKRTELTEAGLLSRDDAELGLSNLDKMDNSRRSVLSVYAKDNEEKLSVFDDLYARVEIFKRIIKSLFTYKELSVGIDGISVHSNGTELDLEMLSSGEQHEIVILYNLLFSVKENSLILIDEPELSLHVSWQEGFLKELDQIAELSNFSVILATHSPQIIAERWDLAIELEGPSHDND